MHPESPETETELQLHQQESLESVLTVATDASGTGIQSTEQSTKIIIISIQYYDYYCCAHFHALQVNPRVKKLILHNQPQLKQLTLVHTIILYVATKNLSCIYRALQYSSHAVVCMPNYTIL